MDFKHYMNFEFKVSLSIGTISLFIIINLGLVVLMKNSVDPDQIASSEAS